MKTPKEETLNFLKLFVKTIKTDKVDVLSIGKDIDFDRVSLDGVTVSCVPTGVETITITYRKPKEAPE